MMATKNFEGYGLRVGVRGGGCGVHLILGFDKPKPTDLVYEHEGYCDVRETSHDVSHRQNR